MIDYSKLPEHLRKGARRYIEEGILPGGFLRSVICNNLTESLMKADKTSFEGIADIVKFLWNEAPIDCWGSKEKMNDWERRIYFLRKEKHINLTI